MSLELMRRWVNSLPPAERKLPLLHVGNAFYTPEQALYEVERGTEIGEELQRLVEEGRFGTDLVDLAKARLQLVLKEAGPYKIASLSGRAVSTAELEQKLKAGDLDDPLLKLLLAAEIQQAEKSLSKAKDITVSEEQG
ncbi:MAG: hypothetical protein J7K48_03855 [Thermococcus sp.]|nr:hypothetical protein [Thermococcus sp.]